jgi:DNA-binding response OmpR family regulator
VVFCTVRKERRLGLRLGAAAFWTKPIEPADLAARIGALLSALPGLDAAVDNG